jgi:hypothetical protein
MCSFLAMSFIKPYPNVFRFVHVNIEWMYFQGDYNNVSRIKDIMLNEVDKIE